MITIQLWIQKPRDVTTLPLKEISLRDLEQRGGGVMQKRLHTLITAEGETLDT
jgi:hypothetical protein